MFGRTLLSNNSIALTGVSADRNPLYKPGGITIDWSVVTAVSSQDAVLPDNSIVKVGQKYLRYGQIMTKETGAGTVQTFHGTASGGTFTYSFIRSDNGLTVTTAALAATATAAQVLAAIQAVAAPGQAVSSSGGALGTADVVVTFSTYTPLGTVNGGSLTGGTVTVTQTTAGTTGGMFGPYDPGASDGRQTLTRGECFILDFTVTQYDSGTPGISPENTQIGGVFDAGLVWKDRILQAGAGSHTLAAGPTLAEFLSAFPMIRFAEN